MSSAPSDSAIRTAALELIAAGDLKAMSLRVVRTQLEEKFGCNLSDKKGVIGEALESFMSQPEEMFEYDQIIKAEAEAEAAVEAATKTSGVKSSGTPKKVGGFTAIVQLSDELTEFMGSAFLPRTEVTKRLWQYIKTNDLQDPTDRREILCDAKLQLLFKRKKVHMFKMTKYVSAMMKTIKELQPGDERAALGDDDEHDAEVKKGAAVKKEAEKLKKMNMTGKDRKKLQTAASLGATKKRKRVKEEEGAEKEKKRSLDWTISKPLAKLLGMEQDETRFQLVAKIWQYIKGNGLQDPADKRTIRLDAALEKIFKVQTVTMFSLNKYISLQMTKNDTTKSE
jgi:upstream activation factor subunit UAF30